MAVRKMTFSLPEDLARKLIRRAPSRERSQYVARALAERLSAEDRELILACEESNRDADVQQLERDFDALEDAIEEPWDDAPSR